MPGIWGKLELRAEARFCSVSSRVLKDDDTSKITQTVFHSGNGSTRIMEGRAGKQSLLSQYRYHLLFGIYASATAAAFYRVHRQPYNTAIKWEQYETIFKGTTLAAAIAGFAMSGTVNKRRSSAS